MAADSLATNTAGLEGQSIRSRGGAGGEPQIIPSFILPSRLIIS
jgi:hypothetical protein